MDKHFEVVHGRKRVGAEAVECIVGTAPTIDSPTEGRNRQRVVRGASTEPLTTVEVAVVVVDAAPSCLSTRRGNEMGVVVTGGVIHCLQNRFQVDQREIQLNL